MKSTIHTREKSSVWLTITGITLGILFCLLATSMVFITFPESFAYFEKIFSRSIEMIPLNKAAAFQIGQPTPFQPGPTVTPTPTSLPQPTAIPTAAPTSSAAAYVTSNQSNSSGEIPAYASVSGLKGRAQLYTLDCEAQAAVDWAKFFGVNIDEQEFIDRMPKSDDPDSGFVGDINGTMGQLPPDDYGVHAAPVAVLLNEYGLSAQAVRGWSISDIKRELSAGHPVIVWIVNMPFVIDSQEYKASNGNTTTVARYEHTWIVIGYNSANITVVDSTWTYNVQISHFKERWEALGNQAIIYTGDQ